MRTRVGIVIPTLNGGTILGELLAALQGQDGPYELEIVAIDSGSTDGSVERLRAAGAAVYQITPAAFDHGTTRNDGLSKVRAEFAVLLVQDAVPASASWLSSLVMPLMTDDSLAGTFARQVPRPGASRVTVHYLERWVAARPEPLINGPLTADRFARMDPAERHAACAFDNVCSCIRKSVWKQHPFRATPIAEDLEWARDVLLAGHRLAYVPAAVVIHSHERPVGYELRRTYLVHQRLQAMFGLATIPTGGSLLRSLASTIPLNMRLAAGQPQAGIRAILRAAALGVVHPLGQFLGARSARERRQLLPTRGI